MRKIVLFVVALVIATAAGAVVGTALTPVGPPRPPNVRAGPGPVKTPPLEKLVVTSPYGPRVLRGKLGMHRGVDLRARTGTPLSAVGSGVVTRAHRTNKGGLSVVVQLDDGWRAGYAHLSRIDVAQGQRVHGGVHLGLSGDTGNAKGQPHLHFELRDPKSKSLVDPWPHLAGHAPSRARWLSMASTTATATVTTKATKATKAGVRASHELSRDVSRAASRAARIVMRIDADDVVSAARHYARQAQYVRHARQERS